MLTNPKYTGHMVWNRRARKGNGRTAAGKSTHPNTKQIYRLRSYVHCHLCGRRMFGNTPWLADPRILILDEATSSLDEAHENAAREAVRRRCTTVTIVHHLSTDLDADLIAVVHKGRIVDSGTPQESLSRNSMFHTMFDGSRQHPRDPATAAPTIGDRDG